MIKKEPTSKDILNGLAGAFSKIEIKDRRITRIHMPENTFHQLLVDEGYHSLMSSHIDYHFADSPALRRSGSINPLVASRTDPQSLNFWTDPRWNPTGLTPEEHPVATLWGSEVFFRNKFEIVSDPPGLAGGFKAHTIHPPIRANENGTYTVLPPMHPAIIEPVEVKFDMLEHLRKNLIISIKSRACPIPNVSNAEQTAIQTLREMISESEYRRYIKDGFILVKGDSGNIYQIFRDKSHTKVWKNGKVIKEVCVRLKGNIPLTDNVIAFKIMVETSEKIFFEKGNVYNFEKVA
jgi:hypothetical protein